MEISDTAAAVLERAYDAASRFNPAVKIRVYRRKDEIQTGFTDVPEEGDEVLLHEGMILYVAADVGEGLLDTTAEHDHLVMKPA